MAHTTTLPHVETGTTLTIPQAWHLLSLDAPTLAVLWACFFARAVNIQLPWHSPAILALGTWLIYVADRILDARNPSPKLQYRHHFHHRHRRAFLTAASLAATVLAWLICFRMSPTARKEDTALFSAAILYLLFVHHPRGRLQRWLPKELLVAILFAAATAIPAWSRLNHPSPSLLAAVSLFAAVCWLNCLAIERWENSPEKSHLSTRWAAEKLPVIATAIAGIGLSMSAWPTHTPNGTRTIDLACALSAGCIAAIHSKRFGLSQLTLRISADAALLTPLLFLPFLQ